MTGWIQTFSGVAFSIENASPEDVRIVDIAHALSHACRFTGHVKTFYSVAEHSVRMLSLCQSRHAMRQALLHDATEAYLVDVPRPVKPYLKGYAELETKIARLIGERFGVTLEPLPAAIKHYDAIMLSTEKRDLMGPGDPRLHWDNMPEPLEGFIRPWTSEHAKHLFLWWADKLGVA